MKKRFSLLALVLVVALMTSSFAFAQDAAPVALGEITQRIIDRGELICGVNTGLAGFAALNDAGEYEGFDVDFCRAVAAAILGDANAISYRPLQAGERQAAVQSGEVDMMSRNTTITVSRDTTWGASFMPVTFYDGQGLMVSTESGIAEDPKSWKARRSAFRAARPPKLNLADAFDQRGLSYSAQVFADAASTWEGYLSGRCDAFTTDKSGLLAYQSTAGSGRAHHPGNHPQQGAPGPGGPAERRAVRRHRPLGHLRHDPG
ncbi:MAG: transporter substrate-binding domain-containing protein [Chloroflexi bacterium]|nr:transporter substrate-binding domain-containing protein [Chloroflexota bacterium]